MEQRWPRFSARVLGLGLLLLVVVAYLPTRHGDFIWDDDDHLTQNHAVQSPGGLRAIWTDLNISRYYPLTLTTFWLEYRAWGLQPGGYHAANVLLHGVNAILLWLLMRRLNVPYAWAGAALWAVHPEIGRAHV